MKITGCFKKQSFMEDVSTYGGLTFAFSKSMIYNKKHTYLCYENFFKQIPKTKFSSKILYLTIFVLLCFSCSKENETQIDYLYSESEIIYYPKKHISMIFEIKPKYDLGNYTINWFNPDSLTGEGPYKIFLTDNLVLDFEISDDKNNAKRFQHEVKADIVDSVIYDYRNDYIGKYLCDVSYSYDGSTEYYQDTLTVQKNITFSRLYILTTNDIENGYQGKEMIYHNSNGYYDSPTGAFFGYHSGCSFKNDSLLYSAFGPLGYYYTITYKGVKLSR
jgi:hypothetical protein